MDPSSKGRLTRSKSQSRTPSPHPTGAAATSSVTTPSHRTDRPWNEVTKGGSTTRDAALASPQPDHPFESANQFTRLRSADDDAYDDGSRRSTELLMPGNLAHREDVAFSLGFDGDLLPQPAGDIIAPPADAAQGSAFSPGFDGDIPTPPAGDILAPPAAAAKGSFSTLEDLVRANAAGIAELREMMRANATTITALSNTMTTTSSQLASMSAALTDATETAARAYRLASNAQTIITGQGVKLGALAANVSKLTSNIDDLRTSIKTPPDLPTLIESTLDPLKKSVVG